MFENHDIIYEPIKLITDWAKEPLKQENTKRFRKEKLI